MNEISKIEKVRKIMIAFAVMLSLMLVGGIPMIIFGATRHLTALLVFGIIFVVAGFYGAPMVWVAVASTYESKKLFSQIHDGSVTSISDLARLNDKSENQVHLEVKKLIDKKYLTGVALVGDEIVRLSADGKTVVNVSAAITYRCPYCTGPVTMVGGRGKCEYCGSLVSSADFSKEEIQGIEDAFKKFPPKKTDV